MNSVLKGILSKPLLYEINLINAAAVAQERGIEVVEVRSVRCAAYPNSLGITLRTNSDSPSVLGTAGMRGLRLLCISEIDIDVPVVCFTCVVQV